MLSPSVFSCFLFTRKNTEAMTDKAKTPTPIKTDVSNDFFLETSFLSASLSITALLQLSQSSVLSSISWGCGHFLGQPIRLIQVYVCTP